MIITSIIIITSPDLVPDVPVRRPLPRGRTPPLLHSGGTTCSMALVQWALLHEMRLMTTFDGLKDDRRHEGKRRKQGRRH